MSEITARLPVEIERPIFECAAWQDRQAAYDLQLVAHRVQSWIEPILYSVVTLLEADTHTKRTGASSLNLFVRAFQLKTPEFFSCNVRHLCLNPMTSFEEEQALTILRTCVNVENLSYGGSIYTWETVISILNSPRLRRLSAELPKPAPTIQEFEKLAPLMSKITHLDVLSVWPHPSVLALVPNLTHLALDFGERHEDNIPLLEALCNRETVRVVTFIVHTQSEVDSGIVEGFSALEEVRFIPLLFEPDLVEADWMASATGGKDMWWRAEETLKRRIRELPYPFLTFMIQSTAEDLRPVEPAEAEFLKL